MIHIGIMRISKSIFPYGSCGRASRNPEIIMNIINPRHPKMGRHSPIINGISRHLLFLIAPARHKTSETIQYMEIDIWTTSKKTDAESRPLPQEVWKLYLR